MLKNDLERFLKDHGDTKVAFLDDDGFAMYYNDLGDDAFCYYKNCGPVFTVSSLYEELNDWDEEYIEERVRVCHTLEGSLYNVCPEDDEKEYFFEDIDEETGESIIAIYIGYEDEEDDEEDDDDDEDDDDEEDDDEEDDDEDDEDEDDEDEDDEDEDEDELQELS